MIAPFFYAWERRLHSRTPGRVVRPFEWGLEWVATNGRPPGAPPEVVLAGWAREALADSPRFFETPTTSDFSWEPAATATDGCAGTVAFCVWAVSGLCLGSEGAPTASDNAERF